MGIIGAALTVEARYRRRIAAVVAAGVIWGKKWGEMPHGSEPNSTMLNREAIRLEGAMPSGTPLTATEHDRWPAVRFTRPGNRPQLGRPRAVAAPWRAQQVVADQPVVGNRPDLVPGRRPDPDTANEVLAGATGGAERELQPGGRGRDRRRDVELDGQLCEAKLDAVRAGCPADEPADCRRRARDASAERRREEIGHAAAPRSWPISTTDATSPRRSGWPKYASIHHTSSVSPPRQKAPHGDDEAAEADPARRWTGRAAA